MKALIIFGSPRKNGNCNSLVKTFTQNFDGKIDFVYAFPDHNSAGIAACINCEACKKIDCVINDDFSKIICDDYDVIVVASPIYMSNLPGPMLNVISRFNYFYHSGKKLSNPKTGVLILTAGGHGVKKLQGETNEDLAIRQAKYIFSKTNASITEENIVLSLKTDIVPANLDKQAQEKIEQIAKKLSQFSKSI